MIKPVFKQHAEKANLSKWIISHFPENYELLTYVEPFCGIGSVLINKKKSKIEAINNVDSSLLQIYRALRDEPKEFIRRLNAHKYCEDTFRKLSKKTLSEDYLENAVNEFALRKMSRGGTKCTFLLSKNDSWAKAIKDLSGISERFQEVFMIDKPALDVIKAFNSEDTLLYCSPPYLHESKVSKTVYSSEMTTNDHIELSHTLNSFTGKAIIGGYMTPLYKRIYKNWNVEKKKIVGQKDEVIWKNY
jgi:DNA adenine methylase